MRITGNTIFIPGATSGIGLALGLALRDKGNTVIVGGRRPGLLDRIVGERDFIAGVVDILSDGPDAREIQVENVKLLRYPEARGDYAETVALINHADPHGSR